MHDEAADPGVYDARLAARIIQMPGETHSQFVNRTYRMFAEMQDAIGKHDGEILDDYDVEWLGPDDERKPTFAMEEAVCEADVSQTPESVADDYMGGMDVVGENADDAEARWIVEELEKRRSATVQPLEPGEVPDIEQLARRVMEDPEQSIITKKLAEFILMPEECDGCGLEFGPFEGHYHKHCG